MEIGIEIRERKQTADALCQFLADTYTLYLRTHNFHWNVSGPKFRTLHLMFEEQYQELAEATVTIAERIRTLGFPAPATYSEFIALTTLKEVVGVPAAERMIAQLCEDHETLTRKARGMLNLVNEYRDLPSSDLLSHRMQSHEKSAWMLRMLLS